MEEVKTYDYRNLPVTDSGWYVSGVDTRHCGGGVLEWCVSEKDANMMLRIMKQYPQFNNLQVENWFENC